VQDRYAGDVGDFGKFGLLRYFALELGISFGINWYLYPDESHNSDGKHIDYFNQARFVNCDGELLRKLKEVTEGNRSVVGLEQQQLLPAGTTYYTKALDFHFKLPANTVSAKSLRTKQRKIWLEESLDCLAECNAVFLDPDNGLEIASCPALHHKSAGKYAFYNEVADVHENRDITIVYHHLNRHKKHGTHRQQIASRIAELREVVNPSGIVIGIRFAPYSPRAYFILTSKTAEVDVVATLRNFLSTPWGNLWDMFDSDQEL